MWGTTSRREKAASARSETVRSISNKTLEMMSPEFEQTFRRLGLEQYLPIFVRAGFGHWRFLCDITESDFDLLGVKLGHRRKLQREIARRHFWPDYEPLPADGMVCREFSILWPRGRRAGKSLIISKL